MKKMFDQEIRNELSKEQIAVPEHIHKRTEALLNALPEKEISRSKSHVFYRPVRRIVVAAACILFIMLVMLPNISVTYAHAMENIPIIGKLVEIFTIRNYFYSDARHELDANIPEIIDPNNGQVSDLINKDVNELTRAIIQKFYDDLAITHDAGYGSIYIDYETVMNTEKWFTLKLVVSEIQASSNTYYKFYHIDRLNGMYVNFGDLFDAEDFGSIEKMIQMQMEAEMKANPELTYWSENAKLGQSIIKLSEDQNFYFDKDGNLVIVYNQYEVGPGSMGCPEIVLLKENIEKIIAPDFALPD